MEKNEKEKIKLTEEIKQLKKQNKKIKEEKNEMRKYFENELEQVNFNRFVKNNLNYAKRNGMVTYIFTVFKILLKLLKKILIMFINIFINIYFLIKVKCILLKNKDKHIIVFYPGYDWYMRMYQRPQHMAVELSKQNTIYFYCSLNINDKIKGIKKIKDNLFITNKYNILKKILPNYTLVLYANVNGCWKEEVEDLLNKKNNLFYEYIDDLHEDLTDISPKLLERHKYILENKNIPVLCTANNLYEKAKKYRNKNIYLSTNGVNYDDFSLKNRNLSIPENMKDIVKDNKKIIGYYGALAKWFDYDLIKLIAKAHKDWEIILIGIDYDSSLKDNNYFKDLKNVHYLGLVDYKELVNYGAQCDVLTIPFLINEITLSTSPVKVFEYMAMEKPIVTTALPECKKYKSVLIAKTHKEFVNNLEKAIALKDDKEYKKLLRKEALENTWENKAKEVVKILENNN